MAVYDLFVKEDLSVVHESLDDFNGNFFLPLDKEKAGQRRENQEPENRFDNVDEV